MENVKMGAIIGAATGAKAAAGGPPSAAAGIIGTYATEGGLAAGLGYTGAHLGGHDTLPSSNLNSWRCADSYVNSGARPSPHWM